MTKVQDQHKKLVDLHDVINLNVLKDGDDEVIEN
jgi:hypothetical protein